MTTAETLNIQRCRHCQRLRHCVRVVLFDGGEMWSCRMCDDELDGFKPSVM